MRMELNEALKRYREIKVRYAIRKFHEAKARRQQRTDAQDKGDWVTVNGTHILLGEEGQVVGGPPNLKGKKLPSAKSQKKGGGSKSANTSPKKAFADAISSGDGKKAVAAAKDLPDGAIIGYPYGDSYSGFIKHEGEFYTLGKENKPILKMKKSDEYLEKTFAGSKKYQVVSGDDGDAPAEPQKPASQKETKPAAPSPAKQPETLKPVVPEQGDRLGFGEEATGKTAAQNAAAESALPDGTTAVAENTPGSAEETSPNYSGNGPRSIIETFRPDANSSKTLFGQIAEAQGFNAKPKKVSFSEYIAARTQSGVELSRGCEEAMYIDQLHSADDYDAAGGGGGTLFGSGIYFASTPKVDPGRAITARKSLDAENVAKGYGQHLSHGTLSPTAKTITCDKIYDMLQNDEKANCGFYGDDIGCYAAALGYDAIVAPGAGSFGNSVVDYTIVLNRSAYIYFE